MKAYIINTDNNKYIGYGDNLDNAIKSLGLSFSNVSGQYIPELNNIEIIKVNKKTIRVNFNNKQHVLTMAKDSPDTILSASVSKLDNGKEWFSYSSDIENTLETYAKQVNPSKAYTYTKELTKALFNGIQAIDSRE
jgi:hypothetical protein